MWGRPDTADTGALHIVTGCKSLTAESAAAGLLWLVVEEDSVPQLLVAVSCV